MKKISERRENQKKDKIPEMQAFVVFQITDYTRILKDK
jgi:hypothetical protein